MKPTITDREVFERDWKDSPEVVVVCRRADGSIAIHQWGVNADEAAVLVFQAFEYSIAPLLRTGHTKAQYTYKKTERGFKENADNTDPAV